MAVRFIIGRAGSGKTHYCLSAIRSRIEEDPIDGPRLLLLVPEQASLQMERAILEPSDESGGLAVHRAEVLSFRRLAHRVMESGNGLAHRALSEPARAMVIRHILIQNRDHLRYYRRASGGGSSRVKIGGFVEQLCATIVELFEESVQPDDLSNLAEMKDFETTSANDHSERRAKLHDLGLIYRAYLEFLGKDKLDPKQSLQVARECIGRACWLSDFELWVDGFASFSGEEILTLAMLASRAKHVDLTLMMDPVLADRVKRSQTQVRAVDRLFTRTSQTHGMILRAFDKHGILVEDPLLLSNRTQPRFRSSGALASLERRFLVSGAGRSATPGEVGDEVEVVELPSRYVEVEYAVSRIHKWACSPETSYRYRDLAIIARDLEPYHGLLGEALSARGIPFFMDRRRPTSHHPLVELLRSGAALAVEEMSVDSVQCALKTGFFSLDSEACDGLENHLLAQGLSGLEVWGGRDWKSPNRPDAGAQASRRSKGGVSPEALKRVNDARRVFLMGVKPWLEFATVAKCHTGADWSGATARWLEHLGVGSTLQRWVHDAEEDGELDQADEHQQVWREVQSFLDDASFALSDVELNCLEWSEVLDAGLAGLTLGLVPPTVDQVLVGSIERSRHPDIKAAVIIGFNDGDFPRRVTEDSILNDDDRVFAHSAGLRLRPGSKERVLDEAMIAYVALTRASEALVVTVAAADMKHKPLRPSPYLDEVCAVCSTGEPKNVRDPQQTGATWDISTMGDLARRIASEFQDRDSAGGEDRTPRSRWNQIYETLRNDLAEERSARWALRALDEKDDELVTPAVMARLYSGPLQTSVSRLESYAACPFQHFARYTLGLQERDEASLRAMDVGTVYHDILEDYVGTLITEGRAFGDLSGTDLEEEMAQSCSRIMAALPAGGKWSDARTKFRLDRASSRLARVIRAQQARSAGAAIRPGAVELGFGFSKPQSGLTLTTESGREVLLRGFIDRVDTIEYGDERLGVVIDYKSSRDKHLRAEEVYHGVSLQLPAYLLVLAEIGLPPRNQRVRPVGGLYVSLAPRYVLADHPEEISPRDLLLAGMNRPRGLLDGAFVHALETTTSQGWFDHYAVFRKKDGTLGHLDKNDAVDTESFHGLLDHTRSKLAGLADGVMNGNVSVSPYRLKAFSPCSWCTMRSVCRMEIGLSDVRYLDQMSRSVVMDLLREGRS